jgi:cell division control protein 7
MTTIQIKMYMKALFESLLHLHTNQIIHRDVKPGNFLYNIKKNEFMLVDFGLAQLVL